MAAELLAGHPGVTMTVTDVDPQMVATAERALAAFGDRVSVLEADATGLPFEDDTFDLVVSWIMLHHTIEWKKAIAEAVRVVRQGGAVVGYDVLSTAPARALHQAEGARFRMMRFRELREAVGGLPVTQAILSPGLAGLVVRFTLRK